MKTFIKKNTTSYNDALTVEYKGLLQLQKLLENSELKIPKIKNFAPEQLELEYIEKSHATEKQMYTLGVELAKLHQNSFELYGLSYNNYIGLNPQKNGVTSEWGEFFVENRLLFQVSMIKDTYCKQKFSELLNKHAAKLEYFLNATTDHPSLVHGDLWSGNVLFSKTDIYLIDPAIYFADREVDLAMTEIFGGFSRNFYEAYNATYPLSKEYEMKKEIYNLYHYLNHYNLFGGSYLSDCRRGFETIEKV